MRLIWYSFGSRTSTNFSCRQVEPCLSSTDVMSVAAFNGVGSGAAGLTPRTAHNR